MDSGKLKQRIAYLEFTNDQLSAEVDYIDELLRLIGFPSGLQTVKEAAEDILGEKKRKLPEKDD